MKRLLFVLLSLLTACNSETIGELSQHTEDLQKIGQSIGNAVRPTESVSYAEEELIGFELGSKLLGVENLVKDDDLQLYLNHVGRWIASRSERPDIQWRFGVLDTPAVNAYALPGGYVLITRGMLKRLRTEAELAAVLAHEIAHIQEKHHLKAFQSSSGWSAVKQALSLGVTLKAGSGSNSQSISNLVNESMEIYGERGLDRRQEFEADRKGVVLAARAGYNPYAMAALFQTLGAESTQDKFLATLFKTHPSPVQRIEHLSDVMGDRLEAFAGGVDDSVRFQRVRLKYR